MSDNDDETIAYPEPPPCYFCRGEGWIWQDKKTTCPKCHGRGTQEED